MKNILLLIAVGLFLTGCKKQLDDVPAAPIVVKGYLEGGELIDNIYLEQVATTREFEQQINQPITAAEVKLLVNDQIISLIANPERPGFYQSETDSVLMDEDYELIVVHEGQTVSASCYVPSNLEINDVVASDEVLSNPNPEDVILDLTWDSQGEGIEYLISLTVNEQDPEFLDLGGEMGKFDDIFALPIKDNFAQIAASHFTYKGAHRITVFSITSDYARYLNYLPTSFDRSLYNAPNNIVNGYGVFAGITSSSFELTLAE